ncbi:MAG: ABC transporter substrate-binding protein [Deltaproteobacteria bacterium]
MKISKCLWVTLAIFTFYPSSLFALDKVSVGLSAVSAIFGVAWVTEDKGIFRKHGIDSEVIVIGGGAARGVSSLIAGDVQFLLGAGDAAINASLRGADVVIAASVLNKGVQRVMSRPELKRPEDLINKNVGITRFGSAAHLVLLMMLKKWGMSPSQIQMIQVGTSPAMVASLDKGGIDAAVLTIPSVFVAEDRGYRVLADLDEMDIYYLNTMLETSRGYLRTHRDQATRFIKAFIEGIAYFKKNKKESLEVLRRKLRTDAGGERQLEKSYDLLAAKHYESVPYPSLKGVETVLDFLARENPKAKGADPKSFVDDRIVREIDASGFIKSLYSN